MVKPEPGGSTICRAQEDLADRSPLRRRVLNASAWSLAGYAAGQIIRFGSNLLMTRLLVPEMFGVMAIAGLLMAALQMFSDVGLKLNIIQSKRGDDPAFLDTAWSIQIVRGALLCSIALVIAISIYAFQHAGIIGGGTVYADPVLPYVIATLSISALIGGMASTKLAEAGRNLALGLATKIELTSQIVALLCMLLWVSVDRSIWALVAGSICGGLIFVMASHVWLPGHRNRWQWDLAAVHEIIHFGKWIFLSSILGYIVVNGDRLILGGLVDARTLGIYVIAFFSFSAVDAVLQKIIVDVSFPALSEVARERLPDLKKAYYRFHAVIAAFASVCTGLLFVSGQVLIDLLYDPRYSSAGWMLQILSFALLTAPFRLGTQCFLVFGKSKVYSQLHAVRTVALFALTAGGFHLFGLPGAVWGIVLSYFSALPLTIYYMVRFGLFDLRLQLLPFLAVFAGMAMGKAFNFVATYAVSVKSDLGGAFAFLFDFFGRFV